MFGLAPTMLMILKRLLPILPFSLYALGQGYSTGILATLKSSSFEVTAEYLARMQDTIAIVACGGRNHPTGQDSGIIPG
jgi:hypothetical protein